MNNQLNEQKALKDPTGRTLVENAEAEASRAKTEYLQEQRDAARVTQCLEEAAEWDALRSARAAERRAECDME